MGVLARIFCAFCLYRIALSETSSPHEDTVQRTTMDKNEPFSEVFPTDPHPREMATDTREPFSNSAGIATVSSLCVEEADIVREFGQQLQERFQKLSVLKTSLLCFSSNIPSLKIALESTFHCCLDGTEQISDGTGIDSICTFPEKDEETAPIGRSCWDILNIAENSAVPKTSGTSATCNISAAGGGDDDDPVALLSQVIKSQLQSELELQSNISESPTIQRTLSCPQTVALQQDVREMLRLSSAMLNVTRVYLSWEAETSNTKGN